jgi:hypothetical protein
MRRDRRDTLTLEDIELAIKEHNHHEMVVAPYGSHTSKEDFIVKEDKLYPSPAAVMEEQLKMLGTRQL